jgi:DNA-binding NtrC family response regulator
MDIQIELLTLFEGRTYYPVGSDSEFPLTAQVILTTSKDVDDLVKKGLFRKELLYRVQRRVYVPPLRERREDISVIAHDRLSSCSTEFPLDEDALALLQAPDWEGNVRSLENVLRRLEHEADWSPAKVRLEIQNEHDEGGAHEPEPRALTPGERQVLAAMASGQPVARRDLASKLPKVTKGVIVRHLNSLTREGLVRRHGDGPNTCYERL